METLFRRALLFAFLMSWLAATPGAPQAATSERIQTGDGRAGVADLVARTLRADYEGDRGELRRLHQALASLPEDSPHASRVRYWRGFALWRRAFNGFNESADPGELERDLQEAVGEFEDALARDPAFVEAKIALVSCLQSLAFLHRTDEARLQALVSRFVPLLEESVAASPDNPRVLWIQGGSLWYARPGLSAAQVEQRRARALATYERGLRMAREERTVEKDPLEPAWGEPELMMSLAWSSLNGTTPDVETAERYAEETLILVPHWHYVRDILLPQIRRARRPQCC